jgi:hypothetical protein
MFGKAKQPTETHNTEAIALDQARKGEKGTTYALYKKVMEEGGTEQLVRVGTVFMRGSGSGGVAFVTGDDGRKYELPMMLVAQTKSGREQIAAAMRERRETVAL